MINSLFKDSHITQRFCTPKSLNRQKNIQPEPNSSVSLSNSGISVNKKPAGVNFCGFSNGKIYSSKTVKKFIEMAADKPSVFNAAFTLGITCLLRPAAIMALPTEKKNTDDKKYAAAQSIASGLIGYGIAIALFDPIGSALKVALNEKYNKDMLSSAARKFFSAEQAGTAAKRYISMLPETILAAPRALVTVALIPPILKYVFGWEKKKPQEKAQLKAREADYTMLNKTSTTHKIQGGAK